MLKPLKKSDKTLLWLLIITAVTFFLLVINKQLNITGDNARYILLSESIAQSGTYTNNMGANPVPETHYPFFYPLVLSILTKLFGINFIAYRLLNALFGLLCLFAVYHFYKDKKRELATLIAALTVLNPLFLSYINIEMTEILYTFLSFFALLVADKFFAAENTKDKRTFFIILLFLLFASFYTKTVGIALPVGLIFYLLARKKHKEAIAVLVCFAALITPWSIRSLKLGMGYVDEFASQSANLSYVAMRIAGNFKILFLSLTDLLFYPIFTVIKSGSPLHFVKIAMNLFLFASFIAGIFIRILRKKRMEGFFVTNFLARFELIDCYFIFYSAACLFWTVSYNRYMLPLLPYLWRNIIISMEYATEKLPVLNARTSVYKALLLIFLALNILGSAREVYKRRTHYLPPAQESFIRAADWIKDNTPQTAVIMSKVPAWMYLYTGRHGLEFIGTLDPDVNKKLIDTTAPDYLICDTMTLDAYSAKKFLTPLLNKHKERFKEVYSFERENGAIVYKISKE